MINRLRYQADLLYLQLQEEKSIPRDPRKRRSMSTAERIAQIEDRIAEIEKASEDKAAKIESARRLGAQEVSLARSNGKRRSRP